MEVVGVDACPKGWIALVRADGSPPRAVFAASLEELGEQVPEADGYAVDIPIGLPVAGRRAGDLRVRERLGPRRSSLFVTPVRAALEEPTYQQANATSRRLTGGGISRQAYALRPKILEADRWARRAPVPVWEVHPELSFTFLLGRPASAPKRTWAGMLERLRALRAAGWDLDDVGPAGARAGVDDVLDAAAAAWSAQRLVDGRGTSLPDPPEADPEDGRPMAIWV